MTADSKKTPSVLSLVGRRVSGKGTASGRNHRYPGGSIALQKPLMVEKLNACGKNELSALLQSCYNGTLNVQIDADWDVEKSDHTFYHLNWYRGPLGTDPDKTIITKCETFHLIKCTFNYKGNEYEGLIYRLNLAEQGDRPDAQNVIQLLAEKIVLDEKENTFSIKLPAHAITLKHYE